MVRHPGAILYHDQKFGFENVDSRLKRWTQFHHRAQEFKTVLGSANYFAVPYEKIVQEPGEFLRRVAGFLNMHTIHDEEPDRIDRSKVHILGNRMRETVERIIDYSNTWREHVPSDRQALAEKTFHDAKWIVDLYEDWGVAS